jgi:hypothetical protein
MCALLEQRLVSIAKLIGLDEGVDGLIVGQLLTAAIVEDANVGVNLVGGPPGKILVGPGRNWV